MKKIGCTRCPAHARSAFAGLAPRKCEELSMAREEKEFSAGEVIEFQSEKEAGFFCLAKGYWKVRFQGAQGERTVRIAGPGDLVGFGECMVSEKKHLAEAIEDSEACFFSRSSFENILAKDPEVMRHLVLAMCKVMEIKDERIAGLANTSVKARVAAMLLSLSEKFGKAEGEGLRIEPILDRKTMASLAGTVPETLARVLTEFEENRIVQRTGRAIYVLDKARLGKYY